MSNLFPSFSPDGSHVAYARGSYPAFRFAFQHLNENNHRAYWTLDVRIPEDGGQSQVPVDAGAPDAGACIADGLACDQTAGASCCGQSVCDVGADGGTVCRAVVIN